MVPTMLYLVLVACAYQNMLMGANAATHVVGDDYGWSLFPDSSNWTQGKQFNVGDVLVFRYERQMHNVMQVKSSQAYENCIKDESQLFSSGNDSVILSEAGQFWYICGVEDHCLNGQKLTLNVLP